TSGYSNKSQPHTGRRADLARSARSMRGNHLGFLSYRLVTDIALAAGFTPAATMSVLPPRRRYEWLFKYVPTVYRKESRPGAERPVDTSRTFGFPLISQCPHIA